MFMNTLKKICRWVRLFICLGMTEVAVFLFFKFDDTDKPLWKEIK